MKLPEIAVRRPVATLMLFAATVLLGAVAGSRLNLDLLPTVEPPAASVITVYPGASATDVESDVTKYLEDQLSTTPGLDRVESKSKDNLSVINCVFNWGTDLDVAVNDIREKIGLAKPKLAEGAKEPFIFKFSSAMMPILALTVTATESSPDLFRIVDRQLADPLKRIPGVGTIMYFGGAERQIDVHFDRDALEAYHLSIQQIRQNLMSENMSLPVGSVNTGSRELRIRVAGRFKSVAEIADVVIGSKGDAFIRLGDVAHVKDSHDDPTQWAWGSGVPGMVVIIQKQSGANSVNVTEAVKKHLKMLQSELPPDIKVKTVLDNSAQIYGAIDSLIEAALIGGILVIFICALFLRRLRDSLVVTLAIPVSVLFTLMGLYFMGYTLNVLSLISLVIALGMVVDDAIVVLDNIVRHVDQGADPKDASVSGASEVGMAVATSTLTIVAVFAPLLFVKGIAGILFGQMAFVILVSILASLWVSLTLTPMACSQLLRASNQKEKNRLFIWSENRFNQLESVYGRILGWVLQHRKTTLTLISFMFASSLILVPLIGTDFFPEIDTSEIEIVAELSEDTRGEVTAQFVEKVLDIFQNIPESKASYAFAGQSKEGMLSATGFSEGPNIGRVGALLVPKEERDRSTQEIIRDLREKVNKLPGVEKLSVRSMSAAQQMFFNSRPISIEVLGHDLDTTDQVAEEILAIVDRVPGTVGAAVTRKQPRPEIHIQIDRDRAASLGLNVGMVADALRTHYYGFDATKFRDEGDDFDIELRLKEDERQSISEIGETPLMTLKGRIVKLNNVAAVEEAWGPVEIDRKNRVRVTQVQAGIEGRVLGDVVREIRAQLTSLNLPPGVSIEWVGEAEEQRKAFGDLTLLLILGSILVYMVMAAEFEDFTDPFIIMFSLPFAFVGVIWVFVFTSTPLNMFTFIGVIMLTGIVVKNAIVLVDYTKQLRNRGMGLQDAVISGGRNRLRPVLMTSLTTIFAMVPLVTSKGMYSEMWNALGITVISGLAVSGLVTLVLIPLLYFMVHGRKKIRRKGVKTA